MMIKPIKLFRGPLPAEKWEISWVIIPRIVQYFHNDRFYAVPANGRRFCWALLLPGTKVLKRYWENSWEYKDINSALD